MPLLPPGLRLRLGDRDCDRDYNHDRDRGRDCDDLDRKLHPIRTRELPWLVLVQKADSLVQWLIGDMRFFNARWKQ